MLYPIEVKRTASSASQDVKSFDVLKFIWKKIGIGCLICLVDTHIALKQDIVAMPLSYL